MAEAKLKFLLDLEDRVSGGIEKVQTSLDNFKGSVEKMEPAFKKMAAAGTAGFAAITGAVVISLNAYADAERAQRQLEHAVIDVSKGTKEQAKAISDLTDALQEKVGIDGDALKMGAAQLSTFGLQSKTVVALTKSLADLTVNQNGVNASADQYVQSANVMAKALNGQFGVLEKSGIRFTETQQNIILTGTESEKAAALIEGLNQNLRETTDTLSGVDVSFARAQRSFGEMQESFGKSFAPLLESLSQALTPIITAMGDWIEQNPELARNITLVVAGLFALVAVLGTVGLVLPAIIGGFSAAAAVIGFLVSPIGLAMVAIAALVAAGWWMYNNWDKIVGGLKEVLNDLRGVWDAVIDYLSDKMLQFANWVNDKVQAVINAIKSAIAFAQSIPGVKQVSGAVSSAIGFISGRATGGPVHAGTPYVVGERGPELFVPGISGTILPNTPSLATAGAGGGAFNIYITGNTLLDRDSARRIGDELVRYLKDNMRL